MLFNMLLNTLLDVGDCGIKVVKQRSDGGSDSHRLTTSTLAIASHHAQRSQSLEPPHQALRLTDFGCERGPLQWLWDPAKLGKQSCIHPIRLGP